MRWLVAFAAACGSSASGAKQDTTPSHTAAASPQGEPCERVIKRSRPVLEKTGTGSSDGDALTDDDIARAIEKCRADVNEPWAKALIACIDYAQDEDAIHTCWMKDEAAEAEPQPDRRPQAHRHLERLAKNAKVHYLATATLPTGKVGPTPATCGCGTTCSYDPALWRDQIWLDLEFEVTEDSQYVYTYESDGKTFRATAVGDLDCDGTPGVWTLIGVADNYGVKTTLTTPTSAR